MTIDNNWTESIIFFVFSIKQKTKAELESKTKCAEDEQSEPTKTMTKQRKNDWKENEKDPANIEM